MTWAQKIDPDLDPRHIFLNASDVIARYGWGKTRGYRNLKDRELVPPPVMTHPDRWRLDQLMAAEKKLIALAQSSPGAVPALDHRPATLTDLLPKPKHRRRAGEVRIARAYP